MSAPLIANLTSLAFRRDYELRFSFLFDFPVDVLLRHDSLITTVTAFLTVISLQEIVLFFHLYRLLQRIAETIISIHVRFVQWRAVDQHLAVLNHYLFARQSDDAFDV